MVQLLKALTRIAAALAAHCWFVVPSAGANPMQYSITGMRPEGISQYGVPARSAHREYLHFKNELGSHRFIYEEVTGKAALLGVSSLRQVMGNAEMVCSIDLECREKALCMGGCKSMYYEMSNTPEDPALAGRNHCTVQFFKCVKSAAKGGP